MLVSHVIRAALLMTVSGGLAFAAAAEPGVGNPPPPRAVIMRIEPDSVVDALVGMWHPASDSASTITLRSYGRGQAYLVGSGWDAMGWFGRARFEGIWRRPGVGADRDAPRTYGTLRLTIEAPGRMAAYFDDPTAKIAGTDTWTFDAKSLEPPVRPVAVEVPVAAPPPTTAAAAKPDPPEVLPAYGDSVFAEKQPLAIWRVPPSYPDPAREAGIDGTVVVAALVGRDGGVRATRILHSIAGLDEAATAAVRQWRFRSAFAYGRPVAMWVEVPVKFSLH